MNREQNNNKQSNGPQQACMTSKGDPLVYEQAYLSIESHILFEDDLMAFPHTSVPLQDLAQADPQNCIPAHLRRSQIQQAAASNTDS